MTILEIIEKAAGAELAVEEKLAAAIEKYPDLAPLLEPVIQGLKAAVVPANLAALGSAIPGELLHISQGKLDPREHPGDVV